MATDLVLRTLDPGLHTGHLVSLLRNAEGSGFFDHDDPALHARNEKLVESARTSFQIGRVVPTGPAAGRQIMSLGTSLQALCLMGYLPIAGAGIQAKLEEIEHPILDRPYMPFLIDDGARREILEAIETVGGDLEEAITFLDERHGLLAVIVCE